jgi:hypothetical protein
VTEVKRDMRRHTDRMRRFTHAVRAAHTTVLDRVYTGRTALLTTASFTAGTTAVWTAWGTAPGLGAMSGFLLWLAHLSADDKERGTG